MKRLFLLSVIAIATACSDSLAPVHCAREKQEIYAEYLGGAAPAAYLASDVWRLDPVTAVYFNQDCSITWSPSE